MKKSKRLALMLKHKELVKSGKLEIAYYILQILICHEKNLGYNDNSYEAELIAKKLGCKIFYPSHWYYSVVYDFAE
jgi:hypothetical protein